MSSEIVDLVFQLLGPLTADSRPAEVRRRDLVEGLAKVVQSDFTHWAWGRGHPDRGPVVPVALIVVGGTIARERGWLEFSLSPLLDQEIRNPVAPLLRKNPQAIHARQDLIPDTRWKTCQFRKELRANVGMDEWLHAVRYHGPDTWSNFWFSRRPGRPPFGEREKLIVDGVLRHVALLHRAETADDVPADDIHGLTPRQRTVLLLLVDGQSRKLIANALKISQHTVDEHVKAIFHQFGVRSATELAAKFLRGR